jgi:SRSO17 transposase
MEAKWSCSYRRSCDFRTCRQGLDPEVADDEAVGVIDETGFVKPGKASWGAAQQDTGSAGKISNCQIGVFAAYVSCHGHAVSDRRLYLRKEWSADPDRLDAAKVPPPMPALRASQGLRRP